MRAMKLWVLAADHRLSAGMLVLLNDLTAKPVHLS